MNQRCTPLLLLLLLIVMSHFDDHTTHVAALTDMKVSTFHGVEDWACNSKSFGIVVVYISGSNTATVEVVGCQLTRLTVRVQDKIDGLRSLSVVLRSTVIVDGLHLEYEQTNLVSDGTSSMNGTGLHTSLLMENCSMIQLKFRGNASSDQVPTTSSSLLNKRLRLIRNIDASIADSTFWSTNDMLAVSGTDLSDPFGTPFLSFEVDWATKGYNNHNDWDPLLTVSNVHLTLHNVTAMQRFGGRFFSDVGQRQGQHRLLWEENSVTCTSSSIFAQEWYTDLVSRANALQGAKLFVFSDFTSIASSSFAFIDSLVVASSVRGADHLSVPLAPSMSLLNATANHSTFIDSFHLEFIRSRVYSTGAGWLQMGAFAVLGEHGRIRNMTWIQIAAETGAIVAPNQPYSSCGVLRFFQTRSPSAGEFAFPTLREFETFDVSITATEGSMLNCTNGAVYLLLFNLATPTNRTLGVNQTHLPITRLNLRVIDSHIFSSTVSQNLNANALIVNYGHLSGSVHLAHGSFELGTSSPDADVLRLDHGSFVDFHMSTVAMSLRAAAGWSEGARGNSKFVYATLGQSISSSFVFDSTHLSCSGSYAWQFNVAFYFAFGLEDTAIILRNHSKFQIVARDGASMMSILNNPSDGPLVRLRNVRLEAVDSEFYLQTGVSGFTSLWCFRFLEKETFNVSFFMNNTRIVNDHLLGAEFLYLISEQPRARFQNMCVDLRNVLGTSKAGNVLRFAVPQGETFANSSALPLTLSEKAFDRIYLDGFAYTFGSPGTTTTGLMNCVVFEGFLYFPSFTILNSNIQLYGSVVTASVLVFVEGKTKLHYEIPSFVIRNSTLWALAHSGAGDRGNGNVLWFDVALKNSCIKISESYLFANGFRSEGRCLVAGSFVNTTLIAVDTTIRLTGREDCVLVGSSTAEGYTHSTWILLRTSIVYFCGFFSGGVFQLQRLIEDSTFVLDEVSVTHDGPLSCAILSAPGGIHASTLRILNSTLAKLNDEYVAISVLAGLRLYDSTLEISDTTFNRFRQSTLVYLAVVNRSSVLFNNIAFGGDAKSTNECFTITQGFDSQFVLSNMNISSACVRFWGNVALPGSTVETRCLERTAVAAPFEYINQFVKNVNSTILCNATANVCFSSSEEFADCFLPGTVRNDTILIDQPTRLLVEVGVGPIAKCVCECKKGKFAFRKNTAEETSAKKTVAGCALDRSHYPSDCTNRLFPDVLSSPNAAVRILLYLNAKPDALGDSAVADLFVDATDANADPSSPIFEFGGAHCEPGGGSTSVAFPSAFASLPVASTATRTLPSPTITLPAQTQVPSTTTGAPISASPSVADMGSSAPPFSVSPTEVNHQTTAAGASPQPSESQKPLTSSPQVSNGGTRKHHNRTMTKSPLASNIFGANNATTQDDQVRATTEEVNTAVLSVTASASVATVGAALGGDATDVQALLVIGLMSCSSASMSDAAERTKQLLQPLTVFSQTSAGAVFGALILSVGLLLLHLVLTVTVATVKFRGADRFKAAASLVSFPGKSLSLLCLLMQGLLLASARSLFVHSAGPALSFIAASMGIVFAGGLSYCADSYVFRNEAYPLQRFLPHRLARKGGGALKEWLIPLGFWDRRQRFVNWFSAVFTAFRKPPPPDVNADSTTKPVEESPMETLLVPPVADAAPEVEGSRVAVPDEAKWSNNSHRIGFQLMTFIRPSLIAIVASLPIDEWLGRQWCWLQLLLMAVVALGLVTSVLRLKPYRWPIANATHVVSLSGVAIVSLLETSWLRSPSAGMRITTTVSLLLLLGKVCYIAVLVLERLKWKKAEMAMVERSEEALQQEEELRVRDPQQQRETAHEPQNPNTGVGGIQHPAAAATSASSNKSSSSPTSAAQQRMPSVPLHDTERVGPDMSSGATTEGNKNNNPLLRIPAAAAP